MKINKMKMLFKIDEDDKPLSYRFEEHSESHWMIEELMLLANKLVSIHISTESDFDPELQNSAVLRRHPPPDPKGIDKVKEQVRLLTGADSFDASTSKRLYDSLVKIRADKGDEIANLIEYLVMKCMRPAEYLCLSEEADLSHYALSFEFYTHFTSPIRRYADILVHRQLDWVIKKQSGMAKLEEVKEQCELCNKKKKDSRTAQEAFDTSFYCIYLRNLTSMQTCKGIVKAVMEKQVVVYVPQLARDVAVFYQLNDKNSRFFEDNLTEVRKEVPKITSARVVASEGKVSLTWANGSTRDVANFDNVDVVVVPLQSVPISFAVLLIP